MMSFCRNVAAPALLAATAFVGVSGCASSDRDLYKPVPEQALHVVPATAQLMREGDEPIVFRAPENGTVYVYNSSDDRLVYTGAVRRGQTVQVDPDEDFVMVDGT